MHQADTTIRAAAGVTVVGLAAIAAAISYSHMTELADTHGETGWRAHMFPLSVDGIEIVASLVLLADKRVGRRSSVLPWAALIIGTGASFAANMAVGGSDWIGRAISGWPAFALLLTIKLLFSLYDHPPGRTTRTAATGETTSAAFPDYADRRTPHRAVLDTARPSTDQRAAPQDGEAPDRGDVGGRQRPKPRRQRPAARPHSDVAALLPAALAAREVLTTNGEALTRAALARQMRADGHPVSTARASALLKALTAGPTHPAPAPAG
jgi:hypothetical protein